MKERTPRPAGIPAPKSETEKKRMTLVGEAAVQFRFLSHHCSSYGYDEREIFPFSTRQICLTDVDAGQVSFVIYHRPRRGFLKT
jgi:hypothetical protein